jgi:protein regulator of cytokinesis 1
MGSRSRSTISRPRREHAADSAQRNWHRRQGEPSRGHENACRFRSSSRHDTRLSARGKVAAAITPAVRPASSMGRSHSVPSKRPRLAETATNVPSGSFVPRTASGCANGHPPSTSKIAMPVPVRASVLPVPISRAVSATVPLQHASLGIGRPPSREPLGAKGAQHHVSGSHRTRSVGSGLGTSTSRNPQAVAVKAKRARRESFRPRPSGDWAPAPAPHGRYGGLDGDALKEEDEDS